MLSDKYLERRVDVFLTTHITINCHCVLGLSLSHSDSRVAALIRVSISKCTSYVLSKIMLTVNIFLRSTKMNFL